MDGNNFFQQIGAGFQGIVTEIFRERIPDFFRQDGLLQLGTKSPIWIDASNLWFVYSNHPVLNNIINKRAELLTMGKVKLYDLATGKEILKHEVLDLLRKPNPLQTTNEFLTQYSTYMDIYANTFIYKVKGLSYKKTPKIMWNLPPATIKVIPTGKLWDQTEISGIIDKYEMTFAGLQRGFAVDEVIFKNNNLGSTILKSQSKILAQIKPLSNIVGAEETANVLIHDHGAFGIISASNAKDQSGIMPLGDNERARIEKQYVTDYGPHRGQRRTIVTNASLTYSPMSFPMRDMMLFEQIEQDAGFLYDAYGTDRDIYSTTKGATFENKKQGFLSTLQNTIIPHSENIFQSLNDDFGLTEQGLLLKQDFSHLAVMKEDEEKASNALNQRASAAGTLIDKGVFTAEECRVLFPTISKPNTQ